MFSFDYKPCNGNVWRAYLINPSFSNYIALKQLMKQLSGFWAFDTILDLAKSPVYVYLGVSD